MLLLPPPACTLRCIVSVVSDDVVSDALSSPPLFGSGRRDFDFEEAEVPERESDNLCFLESLNGAVAGVEVFLFFSASCRLLLQEVRFFFLEGGDMMTE